MTRRRLYLLRHAKSSWDEPGLADHDRPLAPRGLRAASAMRRHLEEEHVAPELVLCSTAARARATLDGVRPVLGGAAVRFEAELYGASAHELLARVRAVAASVRSVMLIGHNPGLQDLALCLARPGAHVHELGEKFPTGALATLAFRGADWRALERGRAELAAFVRPRDLA